MAQSGVWRNWGRCESARPARVEAPAGDEAIAAVVKQAAAEGRQVKVVGGGHSFTGIAAPVDGGVQVTLDRHNRVLSADRATGLVTVEAGIRLFDLNERLAEAGLAMPNLGDIDQQSIAGATQTGTHGTGKRLPGIAAQIRALTLVTADGSVISASPEENAEVFHTARLGLGALGVLSTLTLQTVPAFVLQAQETPASFHELVDDGAFDRYVEENEHCEFYWFPHTDSCLLKRNNRVDEAAPLPRWKEWLDDELVANKVFGAACAVGARFPKVTPTVNRLATRLTGSRTFADRSDRVFVSPRSVRFVEMEYNVPRAALTGVLQELRGFVESSGLILSFPVEVRVAAPDDVWMSTAFERESAYVAVHVYRGQPYQAYFDGVEKIMSAVGGRPHWGKRHTLDAQVLGERYSHHKDLVAMRDKLDPEGRFSNAYLDRVLGPVG